jgi:hypothetical protein
VNDVSDVIPLSPIDHVFTGRGAYPIEFVFAYGGRMDEGRLEESLRRTLALFPGVASRLVRLPDEAYGLEPADEGCVFEVATSPTRFADTTERHTLVDGVETVEGRPLARVRLTSSPRSSAARWCCPRRTGWTCGYAPEGAPSARLPKDLSAPEQRSRS